MKLDENTKKLCKKVFVVMLGLSVLLLITNYFSLFLDVCRWNRIAYDNLTNLVIFLLLTVMIGVVGFSLFANDKTINLAALCFASLVAFLSFLFSVISLAVELSFVNFFAITVYTAVIGLQLFFRYSDKGEVVADSKKEAETSESEIDN